MLLVAQSFQRRCQFCSLYCSYS